MGQKKPISATIDEDLIRWVDEQIKDSTRYRNRSHLIEIAINKLKKEQK
jgi:Arc/MetJ-type ribon-helix-helix transcriptional regulator